MSDKVSIQSQASAVEQLVRGNYSIYGGAKGELYRRHIQAAAQTLRWLAQHETAVRAYVESRKGGRS